MGKIIVIIITMIGIVVGINLVAPVNFVVGVSQMNATLGYSNSMITMSALLPLLLVIILMVFAVKGIGE